MLGEPENRTYTAHFSDSEASRGHSGPEQGNPAAALGHAGSRRTGVVQELPADPVGFGGDLGGRGQGVRGISRLPDFSCAARLRDLDVSMLPVIRIRDRCAQRLVDKWGRPRSPATLPGHRRGVKPRNAGKRYIADPFTADEVRLLIDGCSRTCPTGRRDRALFGLLYGTGLRISEALDLLPGDVDPDRGTVLVRCGKGGKTRLVGIDAYALKLVAEWLPVRSKLGVDAHSPLFCAVAMPMTGGRIGSAQVRVTLKRLAEQAGLEKRAHPHAFRHGLAVDLHRAGQPIGLIQRQLGHSNPGTTGIYLQGISNAEVVDMMAEREW